MDQVTTTRSDTAGANPGRTRKVAWLVALSVVLLSWLFWDEFDHWWESLSHAFGSPEEFRSWVEGYGALGPLAYLLAQAAQVLVVPVPGTLFPPVGALAFGPWPALGLSLVGLALGSALVFLIARRWGRPLAVRMVGTERLHRYESVIAARGGLLLWLVFLLPLLPDDAVCALAGLSAISFRRFMVIAVVGRLPAVAAGVFGMAGLEGAPAWVWALAVVGFGLMVWAGIRYGPALERHLVRRLSRSDRVVRHEG